jgi:hypothetical protein
MPIEIGGMAPLLEVFDMPASLAFYRGVLDPRSSAHRAGPGPVGGAPAEWRS